MNPEIRDRRERQLIDQLASAWRRIASGTPPWEATQQGGQTILWDTREQRPLGTLQGPWTPRIVDYLNAINPYAGLKLAELLWNIGGHGNPTTIRQEALSLLHTMGFTDDRPGGSRR